jgi:hypothetical protein
VRRSLPLVCGFLVAAAAAGCSSSGSNATDTTAAPAMTTSTAGSSGTSAPGGMAAKVPTVTRPSNVEKVDRGKLPAKAQAANFGNVFTTDEQDCIYYVIYRAVEGDQSIAANDAQLAGVTGASIVACVAQDKIAALLTADLAGKVTDTQLECLQRQINGADAESLAIFLGGLVINEPTIVASVSKALDQACSTNLAAAT